jgi:peptide/nickel transport system substrate-binding protein
VDVHAAQRGSSSMTEAGNRRGCRRIAAALGQRDTMGSEAPVLRREMGSADAKTFRMKLREPYGAGAGVARQGRRNVPFIMPKRVAATPPTDRSTTTRRPVLSSSRRRNGSPGEGRLRKNAKYCRAVSRPRNDGRKDCGVERVEWLIIKDPQTQANALVHGERST